jgi:uncharacterized protein with HEPN domain
MSSDKSARALADITYHLELIEKFMTGMDVQAFADDTKTPYAVVRCLEIISEASRRLSAQFKRRHSELPWKKIAGAGNVYRHDYEDVGAQIVCKTIRVDTILLRRAVAAELAWSNPVGRPAPSC